MKEPETYDELVRYKKCVDLTSYYNLTTDDLNKIYEFLGSNDKANVIAKGNRICLMIGSAVSAVITAACIKSTIAEINITKDLFQVVNKYVRSRSSSSGGGWSSGVGSNGGSGKEKSSTTYCFPNARSVLYDCRSCR